MEHVQALADPQPILPGVARSAVLAVMERLGELPGALLPILHDIQEQLGYIPAAAVPLIAQGLNLSRAEVHGVVSFYHYFRTQAPGRRVMYLCRAEACQSVGGAALERHVKERLGVDFHQRTADGAFTLEPVYCLGNCACAPSLMIDRELHGRVSPQSFDALLAGVGEESQIVFASTLASASNLPPRCSGRAGEGLGSTGHSPVQDRPKGGSWTGVTLYVPRDASALSVGAEGVARAIASEAQRRGSGVSIVRNGSRGMFWLEPLVEVATAAGRVAYGPVTVADVPGLFDHDFLAGGVHALSLGRTDEIAYLERQERLSFARVGVIDPLSLDDYRAHGGYRGLEAALQIAPPDIIKAITESGLRGRGGAAFPAGIKWQTTFDTPASQKYIVANADEGDSGTFADRMLMEGDPLLLIEGMTIAGLAVGATQGYIYLRCEYPHAYAVLREAIRLAYTHEYLGADVRGSGKRFDLELRLAAGAYVCGEETALLESLEGKRGQVRYKPPVPAVSGLFGQPTLVHNIVTLAAVPLILERGAAFYRDFGTGRSRGTVPIQLAGNIMRGGLVEKAFGLTLRELLYDYGGGSASGRPIRAVQVGGPLGAYLPESQFDTVIDYEAFAAIGGMLGHAGIVAFDDSVDMAAQARFAMEFCAVESCGKCTPCRIGSVRGVEVIDRIVAGQDRADNETLLRDLCDTLLHGSLCALGGMVPYPVISALDHFPEDFAK